MLASALALTLMFAPPEAGAPAASPAPSTTSTEAAPPDGDGPDGDAPDDNGGDEAAPDVQTAGDPAPEPIEAPATLTLAPTEPGEYQLVDGEGVAIGGPMTLGGAARSDVQLAPGVYYVQGPAGTQPIVVVAGDRLVWDGEVVLPVGVWEAKRAEAEAARAAAERAAIDVAAAQQAGPRRRGNWRTWASPLSSAVVPGFGQILNGQGGKGAGLLFGTIGTIAGAVVLYDLENDGTRPAGAEYARLISYGVFSTAAPIFWIYAIADAYRVAAGKLVRPNVDHKLRVSVARMMTVGFRADARRPGFYDDWSLAIMGQVARRVTFGLSDLSVKFGGLQVWQFGLRLDGRVLERDRVWLDLGVGTLMQVAIGDGARPLDPTLGSPGTTTKFGATPYAMLDLRIFVVDRLSLDLTPRLAVPLTTRYYSANRALPRWAPQLELGAGISTYF